MTTQTKADENGPFKEFSFEAWLREGMQGCRRKVEQDGQKFNFNEVKRHLRQAQKEQLLAVRSVIDKVIERLDDKADGPRA